MSGEYSILSDVIPNIATLELFLSKIGQGDQGVQSTREELLRALRKRFLSPEAEALNVMNENAYVTATCIDPQYKYHFFPRADDKQQAKAWLVQGLFLVHQKLHGEEDNNNQESQLPPHSPQSKRRKEDDLFHSCFMEIVTQRAATASTTSTRQQGCRTSKDVQDVAQEVDSFLSLPLINRKCDPLEWWKNAIQSPLMQELARKLLCTPSSSVFSERMYSEYGNIFKEKRSRLLPKNGESLLFIHHNGRKFQH
ncbi:zinc finger BED domain-containing 4-like [Paramuricea clavata]|uniref:Zinc finger BED domain-containing 4-like n=1 Tax=Paramuricea clavata TaxID=317549 RepID=A0A6S7G8M7_PARCT|nr:zinc finger BED domain-containing 4-like [Paramuricea clavata]